MTTYDERVAEFITDRKPPADAGVQILCEDHVGTYLVPFPCAWNPQRGWFNEWTSELIDSDVVGWRSLPEKERRCRPSAPASSPATVRSPVPAPDASIMRGIVKWFNNEKGYGFIIPDTGGSDVFVHVSTVEHAGMRSLIEGQKLEYELVTDRRTGKATAGNLRSA